MSPNDPRPSFEPMSGEDFMLRFADVNDGQGWRSACMMIERHWDALAETRPDILLDAFKALPSEAFIDNPSWLIGVNYLQHIIAGTDPRSFRLEFSAPADTLTSPLVPRERLVGMTGRVAEMRASGKIAEAAKLAVEAHQEFLVMSKAHLAQLRLTLPRLMFQWARTLDLVDDPLALRLYEDSYESALLTRQPHLARRAAASLAWSYAEQGHTVEAKQWIERSVGLEVQNDRYDMPLVLAAALLSVDNMDNEAARRQLDAAEQVPEGEYWAACLWIRALACEDPSKAVVVENDLVRQVIRHPDGLSETGANLRYLYMARAVLRLRYNGPAATGDARSLGQIHGAHTAVMAYSTGAFSEALRLCASLLVEGTPPRIQAAALLVTAASRLRLRRPDSGIDSFRRASALVEHENLLLSYLLIDHGDLAQLAQTSAHELPSTVTQMLQAEDAAPHPSLPTLTPRELQVLGLLPTGMTNTQIAASLFVTINTIKSTLYNLYRKLGVHDRQTASDIAHRIGVPRPKQPVSDPAKGTLHSRRRTVSMNRQLEIDEAGDHGAVQRLDDLG